MIAQLNLQTSALIVQHECLTKGYPISAHCEPSNAEGPEPNDLTKEILNTLNRVPPTVGGETC